MTPDERAENLKAKLIQLYRHTTDINSTIIDIAAQIRDAVDYERHHYYCGMHNQSSLPMESGCDECIQVLRAGERRIALKEAATIADREAIKYTQGPSRNAVELVAHYIRTTKGAR